MGHSYVGVEHLFLAMIRDRAAVPTQVLGGMVNLDAAESALLELMNSDGYRTGTNARRQDGPPAP
jgi:Clp amino terminal domain, pathogenicity island component